MYSMKDIGGKENKKAKGINQNVVKNTEHEKNILMLYLIKKYWDRTWKEFKVNCKELELMMFLRFHYLVLMIKDIF